MSSSDSSFSVYGVSCTIQRCWKRRLRKHTLFLFLFSWGGLSGTAGGSTTSCGGSSGTTSRANVQEKVLDILALESLSE